MRASLSADEEAVLRELETAFDRIEQTVLPSIAAVLDAVIDSAAGARPGIDAEAYAEALRALSREVEAAQAALAAMGKNTNAAGRPDRSEPYRRISSAA
jgi:hypothetical protein